MNNEPDHVCKICNKPVLEGQARYTITGNHYDCEPLKPANMAKELKKLEERFDKSIRELEGILKRIK